MDTFLARVQARYVVKAKGDRGIHPNLLLTIKQSLEKTAKKLALPFDWASIQDDLITMDEMDFDAVQKAKGNPQRLWDLLVEDRPQNW